MPTENLQTNAHRAARTVLNYAQHDSDAVSVLSDGTCEADTEAAVFAVKGAANVAYLRGMCERQGLLTPGKPVACPPLSDGFGAGAGERYCWSTDEENYHGDFAEREDALAEGTAELEGHDEPGETRTVWTGAQRHAMHFLRRRARQIGEVFAENIDQWLEDDIPADDPVVKVADPEAFGAALLALLEHHATFDRCAVADVQEHAVTVPGEPEARNVRSKPTTEAAHE